MKLIFVSLTALILTLPSSAQPKFPEKEKQEITALLNKQVEAWNEGNIEKFMETYWHSDKLVFVGSHGPTYGWQATLDNYKKGYPDKKTMGHLEFKILDISKIDKNTVFVIGKFDVTREAGELKGTFTLVVQKKQGKWVIISDYSSAEG